LTVGEKLAMLIAVANKVDGNYPPCQGSENAKHLRLLRFLLLGRSPIAFWDSQEPKPRSLVRASLKPSYPDQTTFKQSLKVNVIWVTTRLECDVGAYGNTPLPALSSAIKQF